MKVYGIVTYNMYCNFSNYGSALQQYALHRVVNSIAPEKVSSIVLDYCPDCLKDKDVLNPFKNMRDKDDESRRMAELSLPAIRVNWEKFRAFFNKYYKLSSQKYTSSNFNDSLKAEGLSGYICGSDTIWCTLEFGCFDDGYFGNYEVMKNSDTFSYAASFGDAKFEGVDRDILLQRMQNFKAISVRESTNINEIRKATDVLVQRVVDPTLLLTGKDYKEIAAQRQLDEPYVLMYARRYDPNMERFAEEYAKKHGLKLVDISLRAANAERGHIMRYDAGVEEFISLVKNAEFVVTNSYHGAIFAIQMHRNFVVFSREQADTKIDELLSWVGLTERKVFSGSETISEAIDYDAVEHQISTLRADAFDFLKRAML